MGFFKRFKKEAVKNDTGSNNIKSDKINQSNVGSKAGSNGTSKPKPKKASKPATSKAKPKAAASTKAKASTAKPKAAASTKTTGTATGTGTGNAKPAGDANAAVTKKQPTNTYYLTARIENDKKVGWEIKRGNAAKVSAFVATKEEAKAKVKILAHSSNATVMIYRADGTVEETYKIINDKEKQ